MKAIQLMVFAVIALFLISSVSAVMVKDNENFGIGKGKAREKAKNFLENKEFREQLKAKISACKANETAENCVSVKAEAIEIAKEVLSNAIERLEQHLTSIKEKVEASEKLTDEEKTTLIAAIEQQEAELAEIKAQLEEADTFLELKEIAKELRNLAQTIKYKAIDLVRTRRVGLIVERATHLEAKLNRTLEKLQAQGYDIAELQELIDEFKEKIAAANVSYSEAHELWDKFYEMVEAREIEGRAEIVQQAHDKMKEAQAKLKEAHEVLKQIVQKLRELEGKKPEA